MSARTTDLSSARRTGPRAASRPGRADRKETVFEQISSFVGFFIYLLVFKSFFLPLFIIPTGSMAETLCGAHASYTCTNCGFEYQLNFHRAPGRPPWDPSLLECPNCHWRSLNGSRPVHPDEIEDFELARQYSDDVQRTRLRPTAGDRIVVHGWAYDIASWFPQAASDLQLKPWNVVVFRNPAKPEENYIKRLIGLPGEKIEIIDGDIYADDAVRNKLGVDAQQSLWFPCFDHDYLPLKASCQGTYFPRWVPVGESDGWNTTRRPLLQFTGGPRAELLFNTNPADPSQPGAVRAVYGYNAMDARAGQPPSLIGPELVTDIRIGADVEISAPSEPADGHDGYLELSATRYFERFAARLHPDGAVELLREEIRSADQARFEQTLRELAADQPTRLAALAAWQAAREECRAAWLAVGVGRSPLHEKPVRFALAVLDHAVALEIDGRTVLQCDSETRTMPPWMMRELGTVETVPGARLLDPVERIYNYRYKQPSEIRIAAADVLATLRHVRIERDVHYISTMLALDARGPRPSGGGGPFVKVVPLVAHESGALAHAISGNPIELGPDAFFVLGDNSPRSQDGRLWTSAGPHLQGGDYQIGTVPADQMIGRAFFVYWPGFLPVWKGGPNLLPDVGRIRWIH